MSYKYYRTDMENSLSTQESTDSAFILNTKISKNKMYFIQLQSYTNTKFSLSSGIYFYKTAALQSFSVKPSSASSAAEEK